MKLSELQDGLAEEPVNARADIEIAGLTADSRAVKPGFLFAAFPGSDLDGAAFIPDALSRGAAAVLSPPRDDLPSLDVPMILDREPRRCFARMAARFHGAQPATIAAVTGTNGKSSVVDFLRQIWLAMGEHAASLGTLGVISADRTVSLAHTTPDPEKLYAHLRDLVDAGIDHLAIEASSHGLDQARLDGMHVGAAAFTNLSRDHLDYHPTAEAYFAAKARLFAVVLAADGVAVLPWGDADADVIAEGCGRRGQSVLRFGDDGDIRVLALQARETGQDLELDVCGHRGTLSLPLVGDFQASNVLCAMGLAIAGGAAPDTVLAAAGKVKGVRGRMELAARRANGARIYVDYSHTPDSLRHALMALRPYTPGRLGVVFGCGGDRDPGKRPQMGREAATLADFAIVTDDNPRSEDPATIRRAALAACPDAADIGDRAEAIRVGVAQLEADDVLLVAGKGHEQGQTIGGQVRPFDDVEAVRQAVADMEGDGRG